MTWHMRRHRDLWWHLFEAWAWLEDTACRLLRKTR